MMFSSPRLRRFTFQHGFFLTQIVRRFLSVTNSTSSVESIDSFRLCTWNQTTQVCVADAMRIWSSFNLTTLDAPKLRDLAFMLECASYAQNSTDCSANPFCQKSADGTCRTSSGPTTLRSIYSVAQSTVDSCGWIGATIGGYQCQLHSLSECRNAGCSIKADGFILNGSQCAMGPTCIDDTMSYMLRLCSTDPNWDLAKMAGCFSLGDDTKLLIECTQAVCPQFAAMLEHTLFDPCASLKTRNACMSNSACWMNVQGVCEKDKFNSWLAMAPPDCPLARASAWAERCSEARTAEFCAQLGHECVWEKLEVCAAEGPAAPLEQCRGAPEMLGLYLRPSTNVSPTIDLLSKIIVSAHTCPYVEFQECVPPDRSNGGVDSDAAATPASIMVLVVVGGIVLAFIGACVASCLLWHRHCIVATTQKEGVVNAMPAQAVPEQVQAVAQGNALTEIVSDSQGSPRNAYAENTITEEITASSLDFMHGDPVSTLARGATEHWLIHPDALNLNSEIIGKGSESQRALDRLVSIARAVRVLRVLRVLRFIRDLRVLVEMIYGTLQDCVWSLLLIFMLLYVCGIVFSQVVSDHIVDNPASEKVAALDTHYGSLTKSVTTLYKSIMGGLDWYEAYDPLSDMKLAGYLLQFLFLMYITFTNLAVMNVVAGLFLQGAIEQANQDQEHIISLRMQEKHVYVERLQELFNELDSSHQGAISLATFEYHLKDEHMQAFLQSFDIENADAWTLFNLLDSDGGGMVDINKFVEGCIRLKGNAKSIQIAQIMYHLKWIMDKFMDMDEFLQIQDQKFRKAGVYDKTLSDNTLKPPKAKNSN